VVRIAEEEQRRIGHDLHDGIGQELTGLGLLAETLAKSPAGEDHSEATIARRISRVIGETLQRVRDMSRNMVAVNVDSRGLAGALQELASSVQTTQGVDCRFCVRHPIEIADAFVASHLYRIAQEAIANALRHSQAERIHISLDQDGRHVRLEIQDDGVGFKEGLGDQHGVGLRTMRYRADLIDAELSIERADTGGTRVICSLSLEHCARRP
jgi:signal transduction histidine kinase